jgi:hypothetical protein
MTQLADLIRPLAMEVGCGKRERTWKSLKGAFSASRLKQVRRTLESAKMTIMLAKQHASQ